MITGAHRYPRQDAVIYGRPAAEAIAEQARALGASRLLILSTKSLDPSARQLADELGALCVGVFSGMSAHSPREGVIAGANAARNTNADLLVAFGGGSVIDATKVVQIALWADLRTTEALSPYRAGREGDRTALAALKPGVRMIAVPTTLSAAEFTALGGVTDAARKVKEGYSHRDLAPRAVILDPTATLNTPAELWFSTGMKAIDHAVEQLCHPERAPMADALAEEGLKRLAKGLAATKHNFNDLDARLECQFGMWLAISGSGSGRGMGPSHAIGHTLGGSYGVPHGLTSCVMLNAVLKWCEGYGEERQHVVARLMGRNNASDAVRELVESLGLPTTLKQVGVGPEHFHTIAEHAVRERAVRNALRPIARAEDIVEILEIAR